MALKPENPLVGGTVLRRAAIQSPNFATGVSGWTINQDGSAEFNNVVIRNGQIVSGTSLFYSGPPALGNLVASVSAAAGTDAQGNAYLAGVVSYGSAAGTFFASALASPVSHPGALAFYSAPGAGGPWTRRSLIEGDGVGNLNMDPAGGQAVNVFGGLTASGRATLNGGADLGQSGGGILVVTEQGGAPGSPPTQLIGATAADRALGVKVTGDAAFRMRIDTNGKHNWGDGTATDTTLYRGGASILQTDDTFALSDIAAPAGAAATSQIFSATGQLSQVNASGMTTKVSGGKLAAIGTQVVTQAALNNLFNDTIKGGDAKVGAVYKVTAFGFGQWGSTQQTLQFALRFGATAATVIGTTPTIQNTDLAASALFRWHVEGWVVCVTTGAGATWVGSLEGCVTQSANNIVPGTAANNTVPFAGGTGSGTVSLDSTVDEILGLSAQWGSTTGAPTLTAVAGWLERIA